MLDDREQFILNYVTNFLASKAGSEQSNACMRDEHERLTEEAPIEDAFFIAKEIWNHKLFQGELKKLKEEKNDTTHY